jgi:NAD(P)H-dependent flavin oxidoreductase YrpB (nitropropane dioxygenase family)
MARVTLLERIGVELPVVQAGMGGGVAGRELAGAVSAAGGLGTLGHLAPAALRREIAATRQLTDRPIATNLLLPFAREAHFHAASDADVVVTFWGEPQRRTGRVWVHQCGSVGEARAAHAAGADAVIAQGVEAGGHVRGTEPALELLARVRAALPAGYPVWSAGGVADGAGAAGRLAAGAEAVVSGTRFLLCHESGAHPAYKQRALAARETVLTELFGVGWPAAHRVVPNAATERWLRRDRRGPRWLRAANRLTAPLLARTPESAQARLASLQRPGFPLLSPTPPAAGAPARLLDAGALYAGECVREIDDIRAAGQSVRDLTSQSGP